ncbi:MAG: hypothetical protein LBI42_04140 [Chitinispirillales bacterium]|jgi:ligand-binding sensor domain-containing protein|nr:hypothetical protein [Chitinispirillales bacterium]
MLKRLSLIPVVVFVLGAAVSVNAKDDVKADSISFEKPNEYRIYKSDSPVKAFVVLNDMIWYATDEIVISQSTKNNTHQRFPKLGAVGSDKVKTIVVDGSKQLWFATPAGAVMRGANSNNFTVHTTENGLPGNNVLSIAVSKGDVWVGTENGAARFRGGSWTKFTTADGLVSDKVQAIAVDSKGTVWFGTNRGINSFDGSKWQLFDAKNKHLEWNDTRVLAIEPRGDVLWAATGPNDLARFDGKEWKKYMEIQPNITSIMNDTRRTWFGSPTGILRFNGEEWVSDPNRLGIPASQVYHMYRDESGNLWFAMEQGVLWLNNPYRR